MRTWQRSAIAWTRCPPVASMCRRAVSCGATAYGSAKTGVEGDGPLLHRVAEQERQGDRDLQLVPGPLVQHRPGERQVALRHRPVVQVRVLVGEEQIARPAAAHQRPAAQIDHVRVPRTDGLRAHVAPLALDRPRPVLGHPA
jgi:hypothetical protein